MELLKHDIYYPPTPAMRNIKMWPPYNEKASITDKTLN